jgi:hypothetical protein
MELVMPDDQIGVTREAAENLRLYPLEPSVALNREVRMPQQGIDKQVPEDQRSRGKNLEHPEGEANATNTERQRAGTPAPAPKPGS